MPIIVPESVFDKYYDVIDSTFSIFGVDCQLVFVEIVEETSSNNKVPIVPSINVNRRNQDEYRRDGKTYIQVEKLEDIRLKVYWDHKSFTYPTPNIVLPENSIQTIFFMSDLQRINRATNLIVHKGIKDLQEMRFKKYGQPFPMGLRQNRYCGCFWELSK
jgi:hypothetical protein